MHRMHEQRGWVIWCPHLLHKVLEIWPFYTLNWKYLPCPTQEQTSQGEGPRCTYCHGLLFHNHLQLQLQIGVVKDVLQKLYGSGGIKHSLWIDTMFPPLQWDELDLKVWSWLKSGPLQIHVQFGVECDPMQYENKVGTTKGIHSLNLGWK
jgi:hypothetical protein